MNTSTRQPLHCLGWREWASLPSLGIDLLKCKVDTGARTSCLHAFNCEIDTSDAEQHVVHFHIHPDQHDRRRVIKCKAPIIDEREVTDSGGHRERRLVIRTPIIIGPWSFPIELTLTNRDTMRFRMLLGRTAMEHRFVVDPARSFLAALPSTLPEPLP